MKRSNLLLQVAALLAVLLPGKAFSAVDACITVPSTYTVSSKTVWICKGTWINLLGKNCAGGSSFTEDYYWVNLDDPTLTGDGENFYTPDAGRWELTITDNATLASDKDTITIKFYPTPDNFSVNNKALSAMACTYENITLNLTGLSSHFSNYKWYVENDPTPIGTGTSITFPSTSIPGTSASYIGTAQYDSLYSGPGGTFSCMISDAITAVTLPTPQAILGKDTAVCEGTSVKLVANVKTLPDNGDVAPSSKPSFSFEWNSSGIFKEGGPIAYGGKGGDTLMASSAKGTYNYTVAVKNVFGCKTTDVIAVTVNPNPVVNPSPPVYICPGGKAFLSPAVTAATGPFTYAWTPKATLNDTTLQTPLASPATNTTYTVYVKSTTTGCKGSGTKNVIVTPPVSVVTSFNDSTVCPSNAIDLVAIASGGTAPYTFTWEPNVEISDKNSATPRVTPTAPRSYTVKVLDARACSTSTSVNVDVLWVNLGDQDTIAITGTPLTLDAWNPTQSGFKYTWTDSSGNVLGTDPALVVDTSNKYIVTITEPVSGCSVTAYKRIRFVNEIILKVFVPNVFNPEMTDPDNAHLRVYGNFVSNNNFIFQVFNQWGEVVYESYEFDEANNEGWNGKLRNSGQLLSNGIYTYTLRGEYYDGTQFAQTGTATLLR